MIYWTVNSVISGSLKNILLCKKLYKLSNMKWHLHSPFNQAGIKYFLGSSIQRDCVFDINNK